MGTLEVIESRKQWDWAHVCLVPEPRLPWMHCNVSSWYSCPSHVEPGIGTWCWRWGTQTEWGWMFNSIFHFRPSCPILPLTFSITIVKLFRISRLRCDFTGLWWTVTRTWDLAQWVHIINNQYNIKRRLICKLNAICIFHDKTWYYLV